MGNWRAIWRSSIRPESFEEYGASIEKRRACERLLHISVEYVMDICHLLAKDLRLGLPSGEEDLLERLRRAGAISPQLTEKLRRMRAFRNLLVHRYGVVDDRMVYEVLEKGLGDLSSRGRS